MKFQFSSSVPPRDELYYLASPYSGHDPEEIFNLSFLLKEGYFVFSPILHTHSIAHTRLRHPQEMRRPHRPARRRMG